MEDKLTKLIPIVVVLAAKYYRKMRKPNVHSIDDLISEGQLVIIRELSKGQFIRAYILKCVANHFKLLLNQTYKRHSNYFYFDDYKVKYKDIIDGYEMISKMPGYFQPKHITNSDTLKIDVLDELTQEQKTYITQVLDIPIEKTTGMKYKRTIKIIRDSLGLNTIEERRIRKSLFELTKQ